MRLEEAQKQLIELGEAVIVPDMPVAHRSVQPSQLSPPARLRPVTACWHMQGATHKRATCIMWQWTMLTCLHVHAPC